MRGACSLRAKGEMRFLRGHQSDVCPSAVCKTKSRGEKLFEQGQKTKWAGRMTKEVVEQGLLLNLIYS